LYEKKIGDREEKECVTDVEIDFMNKKRNIPLFLDNERKLFYGYSQNITMSLLEEMKASYEAGEMTQVGEEMEDEEGLLDFPQLMKS